MTVRIGINGFGRMGRLALRAAWGWPGIEFVHINEVKGGSEAAAHLLTFDSVHGRFAHEATAHEDAIELDGKRIGFSSFNAPGTCHERVGRRHRARCSGKFRTPGREAVLRRRRRR